MNRRRFLQQGALVGGGLLAAGPLPFFDRLAYGARSRGPRLIIVFCLDGLRPDSINPYEMPNIWRLQRAGVRFRYGHAVFPTSTNANAAALSSGAYPGTNGILNNNLYFAGASASTGVNFASLLQLKRLSGRALLVDTLAERVHRAGGLFAVVSSGGSGQTTVLNPTILEAADGRPVQGIAVNGDFGNLLGITRRVAFPDAVDAALKATIGFAPPRTGLPLNAYVDWHGRAVTEYVLPELAAPILNGPDPRPVVVVNWLTEPDATLHLQGYGHPDTGSAKANDDANVQRVLDRVRDLDLLDRTDIFLVSDHGFSANPSGIFLEQKLVDAGLKQALVSDDVVRVSRSFYVKDREPDKIRQVAEYLQQQPWVDTVYTAPRGPGNPAGRVEGTFSLDLIHMWEPTRGPDITFSFPWSNEESPYGYPGLEVTEVVAAADVPAGASEVDFRPTWTGATPSVRSNHGGLSPWNIRNTMMAWGVDFKRRTTTETPAGNVDLMPTILRLQQIDPGGPLDGRVLVEALKGGPKGVRPVIRRVYRIRHRGRRATLVISQVGHQRYVEQASSRRTRAGVDD
jgi:predicted AlkP superfamily pyrophosphatase or phosphodiesterase